MSSRLVTRLNNPLRVVPLGGLGEIGMNMMMLEFGGEAIVIDCGIMFPQPYYPGIDFVLPSFGEVLRKDIVLKAIVLTHGHEDHIGAVPFLLSQRKAPVYGSPFTIELVRSRLRDRGVGGVQKLNVIEVGQHYSVGCFDLEFIRLSHSIADACALCIQTPVGKVIHTGDFKIDHQPVDGRLTDLKRFEELGQEGVLLLLSDSTNVEVPGPSRSESIVSEPLSHYAEQTSGAFVVASFASHIPRIQQVLAMAESVGRKVLVLGRSMVQNVELAGKLGYLDVPLDLLVAESQLSMIKRERLLVLCTGTQAEPRSVLARFALQTFRPLALGEGDVVAMSSRIIPGNEKAIYTMINHLYRTGAEVYTQHDAPIHVSGHAYREDLQTILRLVKPKFFVPVHGEYRHLVKHQRLAIEMGINANNAFILQNHDILHVTEDQAHRAGQIEGVHPLVMDNQISWLGQELMKERRRMSLSGAVAVCAVVDRKKPKLLQPLQWHTSGVGFPEHLAAMIDQIGEQVESALRRKLNKGEAVDWSEQLQTLTRRAIRNYSDRRPEVLPVVIQL